MLCFKDMTFCNAKDCNNAECDRNWRLRDPSDYNYWSEGFDDGVGPVCYADFTNDCNDYKPSKIINEMRLAVENQDK